MKGMEAVTIGTDVLAEGLSKSCCVNGSGVVVVELMFRGRLAFRKTLCKEATVEDRLKFSFNRDVSLSVLRMCCCVVGTARDCGSFADCGGRCLTRGRLARSRSVESFGVACSFRGLLKLLGGNENLRIEGFGI